MKKSHIVKTVCAMGLTAACAWALAGCSSADNSANNAGADSGAVAATVNGTNIYENAVTGYIESLRSQRSLTDDASWGEYLVQNDATPASAREDVINTFITRELIRTGASEKGVTVESSEIDDYVNQMKSNYESDEKWQAALDQAGMTEQEYRDEIDLQLKAKYLYESFASDEDPSTEDQLTYAKMYASAYDGAKRSSHILFSSEDQATAQEVLDKINAGELDFAEAAKQYSQDTGSAEKGGDVGWDKTSSLVTEYQTALDGLAKDQVSGLVTSTYGIHIIKCTDVYNAPKTKAEDGTETVDITSVDQIPSEWLDSVKESLKSQKQSEAYQQWLEEKKESSDITINDMPSGLSYDIDITPYQTEDSGSDASGETGEAAPEGADAATADAAATDGVTADGAAADGATADGATSDAPAEGSADGSTTPDATTQQPAEAA